MKKKKICFVVSSPYTAKAFLENHFEILSKYYDIYLIANLEDLNSTNYSNINLKEIKHIPIVRKINIYKDFKALFLLIKYFKNNKFDTITTFTPKASLLGIVGGKLADVKIRIPFFTGQVWHTKKGVFKNFLMFLDKIVVVFSTNIIVDGLPQQEFLIANNILSKVNSVVLGKGTISGLDLNKFSPKLGIRNELRNLLNFKDDDIVFMFLGRLNTDKGILDLAEAFEMLQKKYNNVKLLLVGPDEENLIFKLKNRFNTDNYQIYGVTENPENLIQACDVFCLPSHREAFGLSIIEASACEKPIICSDTYGLMETIIENKTGLRHKVRDVNSLNDKMEILLFNKDLRNLLGKQGRDFVVENFSAQTITEKWLEFYKQNV